MNYNKYTRTCERNTYEMDKGETIQNIFIDSLSFFNHKSSQERNQMSNEDLKWEMFTSFRFS